MARGRVSTKDIRMTTGCVRHRAVLCHEAGILQRGIGATTRAREATRERWVVGECNAGHGCPPPRHSHASWQTGVCV